MSRRMILYFRQLIPSRLAQGSVEHNIRQYLIYGTIDVSANILAIISFLESPSARPLFDTVTAK